MRISDWSSDVCSSDLRDRQAADGNDRQRAAAFRRRIAAANPARGTARQGRRARRRPAQADRQSVVEGNSVAVRVDIGGRRLLKNTIIILVRLFTTIQTTILLIIYKYSLL